MFSPVKIAKTRLIGLQKDKETAINALHFYGKIHVKSFPFQGVLEQEKPFQKYNELVEQLIKLEGILSLIPPKPVLFRKKTIPVEQALLECKELDLSKKISNAKKEVEEIRISKEKIESELKTLELVKDFHLNFSDLRSESIDFVLGKISSTKNIDDLQHITKKIEIIRKPLSKEKKIILVIVQKTFLQKVKEKLFKNNFEEIVLPEISGTPNEIMSKLHSDLGGLTTRKNSAENELKKVSENFYEKILFLKEIIEIEKKKFEVMYSFGKTSDLFYLEFFLPEKELDLFKSFFHKHFSSKYLLQVENSKELMHSHEETPTVMQNPNALSPFEFMIKFVSLPQSNEIDPTIIFFWFFPIFYGLMVGDVGYGLSALILSSILFIKLPKNHLLKPISAMLIYSSLPTILFGIIFDEYFGFPHQKLLELFGFHELEFYHGIERLQSIPILITATILIGLLTICLGFLFGAINALIEKNFKHCIAKISWIFLLCSGTIMIAGGLFNFLPEFLIPSAVIFIIALIPIILFEGVIGLIEIPSTAGNILSFIRILAVGLVGVMIALILNKLLLPSPEQGLILLITIPLYLIGHFVNLVLAMFESLVQGARLNYVEFFSKFFHGGGKIFKPFKAERNYTQ